MTSFPLPETKTEESQHIASEWHHHVILKAFNLSVATIWWDLQFDEPTSPTAKLIKMLKKIIIIKNVFPFFLTKR